MKKLLLIAILALPGCALISAYNMAHFDNNEYALINSVQTIAAVGVTKCDTAEIIPLVDRLYYKTQELKNYSAGIGNNDSTIVMTKDLNTIVSELSERYHNADSVSPAYCKVKLSLIEKNAITIQTAIGAKPK